MNFLPESENFRKGLARWRDKSRRIAMKNIQTQKALKLMIMLPSTVEQYILEKEPPKQIYRFILVLKLS